MSGAFVLQRLQSLPEIVDLLLRQRPLVAGHAGDDARRGEDRGRGARQMLAAHGHGERGALLAAGRIGEGELGEGASGLGLRADKAGKRQGEGHQRDQHVRQFPRGRKVRAGGRVGLPRRLEGKMKAKRMQGHGMRTG
jgi:hypothetical protein